MAKKKEVVKKLPGPKKAKKKAKPFAEEFCEALWYFDDLSSSILGLGEMFTGTLNKTLQKNLYRHLAVLEKALKVLSHTKEEK